MRRVCFVQLHAYPLLSGEGDQFGGAEVQQVRIARLLEERALVSFVTLDHGPSMRRDAGRIRIHPSFRPGAGLPWLRFYTPRMTSVRRALREANAEVYIQRAAGPLTGWVAAHCRESGARFVYAVSSDPNLDFRYERSVGRRDRRFYGRGLRDADAIVLQTEHQRDLLRKHRRRDGIVIPSAFPLPPLPPEAPREFFLFLGSLRDVKRPELFLDLAERLPGLRFRMVGLPGPPLFMRGIEERLARLPNVEYVGSSPPETLSEHFARAIALVNTSRYEGFSNTFLEAWAHEVPVVSLVADPDETICRLGLGYHDTSPDASVESLLAWAATRLTEFARDPRLGREAGARGRAYVRDHHDPARVRDAWLALVEELVRPASTPASPPGATVAAKGGP